MKELVKTLRQVEMENPNLDRSGFDLSIAKRRERIDFDPFYVARCVKVMRLAPMTKNITEAVGSFCLKPRIEHLFGYVSVGDTIAAALMLGFKVRPVGNNSPHGYIGIRIGWCNQLGKEAYAVANNKELDFDPWILKRVRMEEFNAEGF